MVPQVLCGCERPCDHTATSSLFSTWRCLRFSSPAESWTFPLCNRDWYAAFSRRVMAAVMGLFDAFCVTFRAPPVVPELSASFSSFRHRGLPCQLDFGDVDIHAFRESSEQRQQRQQRTPRTTPTTTIIQSGDAPFFRDDALAPRGASTPLWGVETCSLPRRWPNQIPAIPLLCRQDTTFPWSTDYGGNTQTPILMPATKLQ